jgi:16S rRNA (uracil1498-N3)-methyltransferase
MTTLVVEPAELDGAELELELDRFHHLFRVRRLRRGDALRLTDGAGRARQGQVARVGRRSATIRLGAPAASNESGPEVELVVAAPRPQRAGWLVEKATEIGVRAVRFVRSERTPRAYGAATLQRFERLAVAAVEQCERAWVPVVSGVHSWEEIGPLMASCSKRWLLDPGAAASAGPAGEGTRLAIAVGPEGGWTPREHRILTGMGCRPVDLGPRVLRVETAALVALAIAVTPSVDTS